MPFAKEVTPPEVDQVQHDNDLLRERCLLFVASTRAREALRFLERAAQPVPVRRLLRPGRQHSNEHRMSRFQVGGGKTAAGCTPGSLAP
ncbi:hypothetical protein ACIBJE_20515 [Micromonospora sp. NPDC050187]|uniref:hypothetical protein n=1 Tax=Micromonospora sp. NPDC050187 TaxID=3364277 RepID=UPI0037ACB040